MDFKMDMREMNVLEKKIKRATRRIGGEPVEKILMVGAKTVRKAARKRAPKGKTHTHSRVESRSFGLVKERITRIDKAGQLRRAILAKRLKSRRQRQGDAYALGTVFAGRGFKRDYHKAPHYHLVHDGTVERFHKSGKSTGTMPANPFFADAVKEKMPGVYKQIIRDLDGFWERLFRKEDVI